MEKYYNTETDEVMTIEEVRANFYKFAMENPKCCDGISFNDYIRDALGRNGNLVRRVTRYLMVGHNCDNRGELKYGVFDTREQAVGYVENQFKGIHCDVSISCGITRYTSDDDWVTYEIWEIGNEPYILIDWHDDGKTEFAVACFDDDSDAYRATINDMYSYLDANHHKETDVWFGEREGRIDYDDDLYRWNIIGNFLQH